MGVGAYRDGYGSYETMGQDPDELIKYGQDMMRYGFHEVGMPGGSSKYPGYRRDLSDETIKKLNTEQESFIRETEDLRQTIYEKELYLKAELVKRDPATDVALGFQKIISETRGKFEQKNDCAFDTDEKDQYGGRKEIGLPKSLCDQSPSLLLSTVQKINRHSSINLRST